MNRKTTIIKFDPYYCPECGDGFTPKQCQPEKRYNSFFVISPNCPICNIGLKNSGGKLILSGLLTILLSIIIMPWQASSIAFYFGISLIIIGIIRVVKKIDIKRKFQTNPQKTKKD